MKFTNVPATINGGASTVVGIMMEDFDIRLAHNDNSRISVLPVAASVAAAGDDVEMNLTMHQLDGAWAATVEAGKTWCTIDDASGINSATITGTIAANTHSARTATITFTSFEESKVVTISQLGATPELTVTPTSDTHAAAGDTTEVSVTGAPDDVTWTAVVEALKTWCTIDNASGTGHEDIVITTTENLSTERTATVTITIAGHAPVVITITQSAA